MSWVTAKLSQVATIERNSIAPDAITSGTTYVGLEHISSGGASLSPVQVEAGELSSNKFAFDANTILFGKLRPYLAKVVAPSVSGVCSTDILPIRPHGNLDKKFLLHFLLSPKQVAYVANRATGANLPRLSPKELAAMEIPLPPLEEQRRIAGILNATDALRRRRREVLALLDTLPGAIFAEMFGDVHETYTLKEAGTDFRYGTSSKSQDHGLPVLRIPNVVGGDVDLSEIKTVPLSAKEEARFALKDGDILLVRTNGNQAYVGRSAVFKREKVAAHEMADRTWSFASYLIRARLKEKELLPDFIQGFLSSAAGRKQLLASSKTSAGQFNINTEALGAIRVPKVAVPAQAAFVDRVAEIKNHRQQVLDHLSELENLFASLQTRAFAGEL
ncbi:restriction endonuclease subunit S [Salipiger marinus]|uniref:restriction endonuclease subunit S n=1 Tax=Salipiger marinus TaxID=555512 RepID=UPI002BEE5A73|nr:restriction endonuclease subunit S [Salipiger manganoxidans]MEB3422131.1 restriction endonuclease subunit S [Salipiger manganoxidans]